MSIPPLVCNTPPPPDQCEDDKEDFDVHYNLSQEDEDAFDFQSFPAYDNYKSNTNEKWEMAPEISKNNKIATTIVDDIEITSECEDKTVKNSDEEVNLEDLNLSVEPQDSNSNLDICNIEEEIQNQQLNNKHTSPAQEVLSKVDVEDNAANLSLKTDSDSIDSFENALDIQDSLNTEIDIKTTSIEDPCLEEPPQYSVNEEDIKDDDDDFNEFADFKTNIPSIVNDTENPWESGVVEESTTHNFKADFESFQVVTDPDTDLNEDKSNQNNIDENTALDDDDFGDFDDFQSSGNSLVAQEANTPEGPTSNQGNVWSLGNPESVAFTENVNNILGSIFEQELSESEYHLENNLEASLGEAWRYLIEMDERQPYMVPWNNSSGQKTLLKALCIDSRNILFGPKWSFNMPKYAVTLSNAPLQPQKHAASNPVTEDLPAEKQSSKQASTWVDPFTTDGQESCNSAKENTTAESRSSDVQMYTTTKSDKIYASTLSIQPIRQINLPDTHIFTPTDSETPRSKTIHYDNSPTILLPKSALENSKSQVSNTDPLNVSKETINEKVQSEDYWEFQDFKGNTDSSAPSQNMPSSVLPTTSVLRETQILQPVKVELIMPTLNWPEPGEVKETFDDFTDFITNSGTNVENTQNKPKVDSLPSNIIQHSDIKSIPNTVLSKDLDPNTNQFLDDDFDTFQSALPQSTKTAEIVAPSSFSKIQSTSSLVTKTLPDTNSGSSSQLRLNTKTDIDSFFADAMKSESVSLPQLVSKTGIPPNSLKLNMNDNIENTGFTPKIPSASKHDFPPINMLQPTPASSSSSSQKAGQILQPLSLESYSQINWPNPGIDLQDLSKFNPVESLQSLKSDLGSGTQSKVASPIHNHKAAQGQDDDWGEFISIKPKQQHTAPNSSSFPDDDEWSDFMSSPVVKPINGLNTISLNVHANSNQKNSPKLIKKEQTALGIPTLNYITPKSGGNKSYSIDRHLQRL